MEGNFGSGQVWIRTKPRRYYQAIISDQELGTLASVVLRIAPQNQFVTAFSFRRFKTIRSVRSDHLQNSSRQIPQGLFLDPGRDDGLSHRTLGETPRY